MQEELVGLQKRLGVTFVHVTHDQEEAMNIADRIVVLNHGRIEDQGSPDRVYLSPATLFAATFMGESNILSAVVSGRRDGLLRLRTSLAEVAVEGEAADGARVHLSLRPEHIRLEAAPDAISLGRVRIRETVFQGAHRRCHAVSTQNDETELLLRVPVERPVHSGEGVRGVRASPGPRVARTLSSPPRAALPTHWPPRAQFRGHRRNSAPFPVGARDSGVAGRPRIPTRERPCHPRHPRSIGSLAPGRESRISYARIAGRG